MVSATKTLKKGLLERSKLLSEMSKDKKLEKFIEDILNELTWAFAVGDTVFTCGNGGSKSTADHFVAELVGRYKKDRKPLSAISLGSNTSILTCVSNDWSYDSVFSRELDALAGGQNQNGNDLLIAFSTSGNSKNIIKVLEKAILEKGMPTFLITGKDGGKAAKLCRNSYIVPSEDTALIQEATEMIMHIICERIDEIKSEK